MKEILKTTVKRTERCKDEKEEATWKMEDLTLEEVEQYKYLGVEIEKKKKWASYKTRILNKAKKAAGSLKWICRGNSYLSTKLQEKIWFGIGRSNLEYACDIWDDETKWEEAEVLQRKVMRYILKAKKNTSNVALYGELNWKSLKERRTTLKLRYWRKVVRMKKERLTKIAYETLRKKKLRTHGQKK